MHQPHHAGAPAQAHQQSSYPGLPVSGWPCAMAPALHRYHHQVRFVTAADRVVDIANSVLLVILFMIEASQISCHCSPAQATIGHAIWLCKRDSLAGIILHRTDCSHLSQDARHRKVASVLNSFTNCRQLLGIIRKAKDTFAGSWEHRG